ncbi:MAG: phosphoribosylaminoimidazolesuccinocarboxamide synthase [Oceanococcaceae bacterium]
MSLHTSELRSLPLLHRGKVRDMYAVGESELLIVATDRLSAFDVVLPDPIPGKGAVLTQMANFWFEHFSSWMPNHLSQTKVEDVLSGAELEQVQGQAIIVRKVKPLPLEAIIRGYIIGSGWKDYQNSGAVCGITLPTGLQQAQQLPEPIFTPSTKAAVGAHDENVDFEHIVNLVGRETAEQVRALSVRLYTEAAEYARGHGIIIADTKLEFGMDEDGKVLLIDEVLTPDSSRFWPMEEYQVGISPPSYDKQFVRDYLETLDWNKTAPGPRLPAEIIERTSAKYREALTRLTR